MEMTDRPDISVRTQVPAERRRLSVFDQVNLNVFWIANNFHWQALLAVVIPSMVATFLDPGHKAINLAIVVNVGTLVAFVVNPLVGAISDYATFRMGRRRPFMIIGTLLNVIVLVLFAFAPTWFSASALLFTFAVLFVLLQFSNNLANSPWSAIIADKVPYNQRGLSSGFNGLFTLLGTILGSVVAGIILGGNMSLPLYKNAVVQVFLLIAVVQIVFVTYTVLTVKEVALPPEQHVKLEFTSFFQTFSFQTLTISRYLLGTISTFSRHDGHLECILLPTVLLRRRTGRQRRKNNCAWYTVLWCAI